MSQGIDVAYVHPSFLEDEPLFNLPAILTPLHSFGERGSAGYVQGGQRRMRPENGTGKEKVIATELLLVGRFWYGAPTLHLIAHAGCSQLLTAATQFRDVPVPLRWVPFVMTNLMMYFYFGCSIRTIMTKLFVPIMHLQLPILAFNVMFHPPDTTPTGAGCYALDSYLDPLSAMLGENCHEDHHLFPARAKRPGGAC